MTDTANDPTLRMTGGRALAEMLKLHDCGPMFGMGGFQLLPFYDAVRELGLSHTLINDERCGPSGPARGEHHRHVAGGGVGVDADGVERAVHHPPEHGIQGGRISGRIGGDDGQHRRHVGLDHPHPLGDTHHPSRTGAGGRHLGVGVGGHDGGGRRGGRTRLIEGIFFAGPEAMHVGADPIHRIANADHAGGGDYHLGGFTAHHPSGQFGHLRCVRIPHRAGGHVGVLRDDHHRPRPTIGDVGSAQRDAWPREPAPGEDPCRGRSRRGGEEHHVLGPVLDPDIPGMQPEPAGKRDLPDHDPQRVPTMRGIPHRAGHRSIGWRNAHEEQEC